jgi:uncharacterized protein YcbK (DUF882 family)
MNHQKKISRRVFALGMASAGVCDAASPLINLSKKNSSLVNFSNKGELFPKEYDGSLLGETSWYYDPEPDLRRYDVSKQSTTSQKKYKPKRNFELIMTNANTGEQIIEQLRVDTFNYGINYNKLDHFLRDWRENKTIKMNKRVVDILLQISERSLGDNTSLAVRITSGYRTRKTNSYLRRVSKNVAENSLHIKGQAIDFTIDNLPHKKLNNIAKEHAFGGLGVYDNFIHIDSGPFRRWNS